MGQVKKVEMITEVGSDSFKRDLQVSCHIRPKDQARWRREYHTQRGI